MQNLHNAVLTQTYAVHPISVITLTSSRKTYYPTPIRDRSVCSIRTQNFPMLLQDGLPVPIITRPDHMCSISGVALQRSV